MSMRSSIADELLIAALATTWASFLLYLLGRIGHKVYLKASILGDVAWVLSSVLLLPGAVWVFFTAFWTVVLIVDIRRYRDHDDDDKPPRRRRKLRVMLRGLMPTLPTVRIPRLHPVGA